jgi:hypothetical protein
VEAPSIAWGIIPLRARGARLEIYKEVDPAYLVPALPTPPAGVIDCCCELLSSGRPFSEVLEETKRLVVVAKGQRSEAASTQQLTVEHESYSSTMNKRSRGRALKVFVAALTTLLVATAALWALDHSSGSAEPAATAALTPVSEPPIALGSATLTSTAHRG